MWVHLAHEQNDYFVFALQVIWRRRRVEIRIPHIVGFCFCLRVHTYAPDLAIPNVLLDVIPNTFLVFLPCEFVA